jgi:hypothetical protein
MGVGPLVKADLESSLNEPELLTRRGGRATVGAKAPKAFPGGGRKSARVVRAGRNGAYLGRKRVTF